MSVIASSTSIWMIFSPPTSSASAIGRHRPHQAAPWQYQRNVKSELKMISILKNLAWKELHEQSSATLAATAVTLSIPLCYVFRDVNAAYFGVHTGFWGYPLFAGIFFGMRAAVGERASRTASFIAALPVSYRLLGAARLGASLVAAAVPVVVLLLLGTVLQPRVDDFTESRAMALA